MGGTGVAQAGGPMKNSRIFVIALLLSLSACDADVTESVATTDEAVTSNDPVYLVVRPDFRRCVAPRCGGFWVKRASYGTTRCADGSYQDECYVAGASTASLHFDEGEAAYFDGRARAGLALVKGVVASKSYAGFGNLGVLKVSE